ncbi:MAG: heavy-metal-associated domain-containing protein, partial [Chloroflexota bacterium]
MKTILRSQELSCPSCVAKIEKALNGLDGVEAAKV